MKFWKKFWLFVLSIIIVSFLHIYTKDIGKIEFSLANKEITVGLYVISIAILSFWFSCFIIKSFFTWIISLFVKDKSAEEIRSINELAKLIVSSDYDISQNIEKISVIESMSVLKTAIILKQNIKTNRYIEKAGIPAVDIHILKRDLQDLIKKQDLKNSINLVEKILKKYTEYVNLVRDEILEISKLAKLNDIHFNFDPRKFKYNLPKSFIEKYLISLDMMDFEKESNPEAKLKIIERIYKNYPHNIFVANVFLDFIEPSNNSKKIIEIIKASFELRPDRNFAYNLIKTGRKDVFEVAQEISQNVSDNNIEKLWFLLIIATKLGFVQKSKELIKKIYDNDETDEIFRFYVENQTELSKDSEIIEILKGI